MEKTYVAKTNRDYVRKFNDEDTAKKIDELMAHVSELGYAVEVGTIGKKTTYALLYKEDSDEEIVGYTFVKNSKYMNANVGVLKALQQALARKEMLENKENEQEVI